MQLGTTQHAPHRLGTSVTQVIALLAMTAALLAIVLPVLAMTSDMAGIAGSKRNLMQLHIAHQMYASDHNGNQWVRLPHSLAAFGNTYQEAFGNYINSIGGCDHPTVGGPNCEIQSFLGWADSSDDGAGLWRYPWNVWTVPIHLDNSQELLGTGFHHMINLKPFTDYLTGRVYDPVFFAPKHEVALDAVGEICMEDHFEFCMEDNETGLHYRSTYSMSPAALFHPDMWSVPEYEFVATMDEMFTQHPNAFHALPYASAKHPDLKTHMMENFWLQNVDPGAGECNPSIPGGEYDGCSSWLFNASIASAPATLFYDGHVRLLPLTEVQKADDLIGVTRRDTPMGPFGYFEEFSFDGTRLSHHILTNGGILGRDTLGPNGSR